MALPVLTTPTYELTVPSTKQKVKFRPFLVKEEKALMIAHQSEDADTMANTLKDVISACTSNKVDVDKLAMFDIEYIFTQLRSKSVGEISQIVLTCNQCNDPKAKVNVDTDISKLEVTFAEDHASDIKLFGDVGVKMKYPGMRTLNALSSTNAEDIENIFNVIVDCIDYVYDSDTVYPAAEQTKQELSDFISNLTQEQFTKLQNFFETMPKLEKQIEFDCPVCGYHHKQVIQGLESFF